MPKFTGCVIVAGVLSVFKKPCYITTLGISNVVNAHPKLQTYLAMIEISMYVVCTYVKKYLYSTKNVFFGRRLNK